MTFYFTGDVHGDPVSRCSFKKNPTLKNLTEEDYMFFLGDFGVPWGINRPSYRNPSIDWGYKRDKYILDWLAEKPWQKIIVTGNHDDYDAIKQMPPINKFGSNKVRQFIFDDKIYDNLYVIDQPSILLLEDKKFLCLSGANSHDIQDGILDPEDENFEKTYKQWSKDPYKRFRVRHWSWWDEEKIDIAAIQEVLVANENVHFDYILSHQVPGILHQELYSPWNFRPYYPEDDQKFLDEVRKNVDFDKWYCGHYHHNYRCTGDLRVTCLFDIIMEG